MAFGSKKVELFVPKWVSKVKGLIRRIAFVRSWKNRSMISVYSVYSIETLPSESRSSPKRRVATDYSSCKTISSSKTWALLPQISTLGRWLQISYNRTIKLPDGMSIHTTVDVPNQCGMWSSPSPYHLLLSPRRECWRWRSANTAVLTTTWRGSRSRSPCPPPPPPCGPSTRIYSMRLR